MTPINQACSVEPAGTGPTVPAQDVSGRLSERTRNLGTGATTIRIGRHVLPNNVLLAPMSGVSDLPFRRLAHDLGAGLVVSEMVASRELVGARPDVVRRASGDGLSPHTIQLVGCEAHWMAEGARIAEASGAEIIDINMGCPAREVTGRLSGSALMREPDQALALVEAVTSAVRVPVTLKMRLGWDDRSVNAPAIARRAEEAGVCLVTVHGRTRNQFFKGTADWRRVADVKEAVSIPVVVNGDITGPAEARDAMTHSGADGVMIGRGAYGAPWLPARIAATLAGGDDPGPPTLARQRMIAHAHVSDMLEHYGRQLGLKNARKHVGWYIVSSGMSAEAAKLWRRRLCTEESAEKLLAGLSDFYAEAEEHAA